MIMYDSIRKMEVTHPDYTLGVQIRSTLMDVCEKHGLGFHGLMISDGETVVELRMLKDIKGKSFYNERSQVLYISLFDLLPDKVWELLKGVLKEYKD